MNEINPAFSFYAYPSVGLCVGRSLHHWLSVNLETKEHHQLGSVESAFL